MGMGGALQLHLASGLRDDGWFRSFQTKRSVDAQGQPIPWYSYPFLYFIAPRIKAHFEVFEYGSGNSTRWYAQRVQHIAAVEHDTDWIKIVAPQLPQNARLIEKPLGAPYVQAVALAGKKYHLVVVDGRQRVDCARYAINYLTPDGVLILDNSEREIYQPAREYLQQQGFRCLDFRGMTPIVSINSCTSVFYRDGNCLDI